MRRVEGRSMVIPFRKRCAIVTLGTVHNSYPSSQSRTLISLSMDPQRIIPSSNSSGFVEHRPAHGAARPREHWHGARCGRPVVQPLRAEIEAAETHAVPQLVAFVHIADGRVDAAHAWILCAPPSRPARLGEGFHVHVPSLSIDTNSAPFPRVTRGKNGGARNDIVISQNGVDLVRYQHITRIRRRDDRTVVVAAPSARPAWHSHLDSASHRRMISSHLRRLLAPGPS